MNQTMKRPHQITGVVVMLFSAFIARESIELDYYTQLGPGPGFFPFWLALLLFVLGATMLYHATFTRPDPMPGDFYAGRTGYIRSFAVIVSFVWLVLTMERLGFRISMAVFFLWLLITLGRPTGPVGWALTAGVTIGGSWGAFWMFNDLLKVIFPLGPWGF
jgi:putative tricarboxylic transport membrane protein